MSFQASQLTQDETPSEVAMAETMAAMSLIQKSHFLPGAPMAYSPSSRYLPFSLLRVASPLFRRWAIVEYM